MKLISQDSKPITVIAETFYEAAMAEIFLDGMSYARYATIKKGRRIVGAKFTVAPEKEEENETINQM